MQFYCPTCQQIHDLTPETTLTTKLNQQAYKAHCPTCQQDLACYGAQEVTYQVPKDTSSEVN